MPTGPALDPAVWVACSGENLLTSIPSWRPLTEVPLGERVEPPNTEQGNDQARTPDTVEAMTSQCLKLVFAADHSKPAGAESSRRIWC